MDIIVLLDTLPQHNQIHYELAVEKIVRNRSLQGIVGLTRRGF